MRLGAVNAIRVAAYRTLLRHRVGPKLAVLPHFKGPVLVMGSAPGAQLPDDFGPHWKVVTVNGSQAVAARLGIDVPDLTFMGSGLLTRSQHSDRVWENLKGTRTRHIAAVYQPEGRGLITREAARLGVTADTIIEVSFLAFSAILDAILGFSVLDLRGAPYVSNGMRAIILAHYLTDGPVAITGFSASKIGHGYEIDQTVPGVHVLEDAEAMKRIVGRGLPIFAVDAPFAENSGLRRWLPQAAKKS